MMTKGDMETRITSMESRITSMESRLQPPPTSNPTASMPYGMPGYGSTTLASSSSTAAATLSTAPPTSSPTLPITKDLCADIRVTIVQIQAALQEMIQLERKREAVVHLQAATRKFLARRLVRVMRKEQQDQAASFIQAAVRLQAAARRLLARRRLQEMRRKMHEAALMAVDLGKGSASSPRQKATSNHADVLLSSCVSKVLFPRSVNSNSAAAAIGEAVSSLPQAGMHCLAPPLFATGRREDVSAGRNPD